MFKPMPDLAYLKSILHYDPITGTWTWLVDKNGIKNSGEAGCLSKNGYIHIKIDDVKYLAHRLSWYFMTGQDPGPMNIDHKNLNRSDNRWENLRIATNNNNKHNRNKLKNNKSGLKGVCWHKQNQKWQANISINGKQKHLGYFIDKNLAFEAYKKACDELHGEFKNY